MLAFDLEATGLDPHRDRIVELAIVKVKDGSILVHERFRPGVSIPSAATAVHGISDADVAHCDPFTVHAARVQKTIDGAVLVGYGSHRFDTPLLDAELHRAGQPGLDLAALPEIDLLRVWAASEPRTLASAVQRFLGHGHEGAHGALADAEVLPGLILAMQHRWGLEDHDLLDRSRPVGEVDRSRRLRIDPRGNVVFNFGKHRGRPVRDHPDYLEWALQEDFPADTKAAIRRLRDNGWRWP